MTDSNLMDAKCIHGNTWYDCHECHLQVRKEFEDDQRRIEDSRLEIDRPTPS